MKLILKSTEADAFAWCVVETLYVTKSPLSLSNSLLQSPLELVTSKLELPFTTLQFGSCGTDHRWLVSSGFPQVGPEHCWYGSLLYRFGSPPTSFVAVAINLIVPGPDGSANR